MYLAIGKQLTINGENKRKPKDSLKDKLIRKREEAEASQPEIDKEEW